MLWAVLAAAAAPLQVARNAFQRGMIGEAGPWGATLVRFLFGLPFSLALLGIAVLATPDARPTPDLRFLVTVGAGGMAQIGATACLLLAMERAGFAVATFLQQAALPFGAVLGWIAFGDGMNPLQWLGVGVTTVGLLVLSWPKEGIRTMDSGALLGLAAAAFFALSMNGYRQAGLALEPRHPIFAGIGSVVAAQALQSVFLGGALAALRPAALRAVFVSWRASLGAGACGAGASALLASALAMSPPGPVRAISVIEAPIAALAGRTLFRERLTPRQLAAGAATALGVVVTALA
ncbi:EamA family transporter [Phenylobacterium sp.]|uniref:EamA family transporter n=1 Tax=Phenylobacterium sp. TaxID=1871053 RepID=UPI0025D514DC|nr:EamA family transporter [Phenylobacterium sp.]MCA6286415.1 EamA family transporter [Phenylobacterium sp.]MCA6289700.1 EamA family transporter [Phenylobacterium sp.]MCA6310274.1 EamA family transporter [Phenylobacterium sp.]MCA6324867.1 EamA family transporter [Phenylobacterium sp.]MCA6336591.1 EamA family transporter [Phenylobacterium sp.]